LAEQIRQLHAADQPLNITAVKRNQPDLIEAVYDVDPFWGWKQALEAADLDYDTIRTELCDYCVCRICGFRGGGLIKHLMCKHNIHPRKYRSKFPGAELYSETSRAKTRFARVKAVKTIVPHWERIWSPEYVLDRVAYLAEEGCALNANAVLQGEPGLMTAAVKCFASWDSVLENIGLNPAEIRLVDPKKPLTKTMVINRIRQRQRAGLAVNNAAVQKDDLRLWNAARRKFGSHSRALQAAGISPASVRKYRRPYTETDRQAMLKAVRAAAGKSGVEHDQAVIELRQKYQYVAVRFYRGRWAEIAKAAGVEPWEIRRSFRNRRRGLDSNEGVIAALRHRIDNGKPMAANDLFHDDRVLYDAVLVHYGRFYDCYPDIGLTADDMPRRTKYSTKDEVIAAIQERYRRKRPLGSGAVEYGRQHRDRLLVVTANKLFGRWRKALVAAGIPRRDIPRQRARPRKYPTPDSIMSEIRRRHGRGQTLKGAAVHDGPDADRSLIVWARRYFGGWPAAVRAAGLCYEQVAPPKNQRKRR